MSTPTRCLSVRQPWAWAICSGEKDIENRTWSTGYRGTIAIHASGSKGDVNAELKDRPDTGLAIGDFTFGAIIGIADVVDCIELDESLDANLWASGPICWKLQNARFIAEPIPMKGKLHLYSLKEDIVERLEQQLALAAPESNSSKTAAILDAVRPSQNVAAIAQAYSYMDAFKFDDLVRVCDSIIERDPTYGFAYQLRAGGRVETGHFAEAIADADRAIQDDPESCGAYYSRALAKAELGDEQGAELDYNRARELGADLPPLDELPQDDSAGDP